MKTIYILVIIFVLPVLVMASVFDSRATIDFGSMSAPTRAYRLTQQLTSYPDAGGWISGNRNLFFYNLPNPALPDSMQMDSYDPETSEWIIAQMTAHIEYNAAGYVVSNQINMNFMTMYFPIMLGIATYDAQNRLTHYYLYQNPIFRDTREWVPTNRIHLIYGANDTFEVYSWNYWQEERTVEFNHSTFTYDTQGRILQETSYISPDSLNWTQDYRQTYVYHPQDTSTGASFIDYVAHNLPFMYINDNFDFPGLITSELGESWQVNSWVPESQTLNDYNTQLQKTLSTESYWTQGVWMQDHREYFYYDAAGNPSYSIKQDNSEGTFYDTERIDFTWESYSSINDPAAPPSPLLSLNLYPSPFSSTLNLVAESKSTSPISFRIYNLKGQLVRDLSGYRDQIVVWDGKDISGNETSAGIYIINTEQDGYSRSLKTIRIK